MRNESLTNFYAQALNCISYYPDKCSFKEETIPNVSKACHKVVALSIGTDINDYNFQSIVHAFKKSRLIRS